MKKRFLGRAVGLICVSAFLCSTVTVAQDGRGDWSLTGADAGQNGWQKDESILSPESVAANFKFLWKIQLGKPTKADRSFSEPLLGGSSANRRCKFGGISADAAAAAATRDAPLSNRRRVSLGTEGYDESIRRAPSHSKIVAVSKS